jgi:hypothetical protein
MAPYVMAAGALISMAGQYRAAQQQAAIGRYQADLAEQAIVQNQYISDAEAANARWQASFAAGLKGQEAERYRSEAGITMAQAAGQIGEAQGERAISERQAGNIEAAARAKEDLAEQDIQLNETKAFTDLTNVLATKKAQFGRSGVRVNTGSPESFLGAYWDRKSGEISSASDLLRSQAALEESNSFNAADLIRRSASLKESSALYGAELTRAKGTIQLDEAALADSYVPYLLGQGEYQAGMIKTKSDYNNSLLKAQAAIYRAGADQAITAGWLNMAGTATKAYGAYNTSGSGTSKATESVS